MVDLEDMQLFVRAVTDGSLSAAGRELGHSPAVASKRLTRLEKALGARLLQRSSRRLILTDAGSIFYERCVALLAELEDASAAVGAGQMEARGTLHVAAPADLGRQWIGPLAASFAERHPHLRIRLSMSDATLDIFEHAVDVAVRSGAFADSRLIARRLARNRRILCASPAYLEKHGMPRSIEELEGHRCLILHRPGSGLLPWTLQTADGVRSIRPDAAITCDNGDMMRALAVAGHGIAFKSEWDIAVDVREGRLVPLLNHLAAQDTPIYAMFPSRQFMPAKIRLFVDFLEQELGRHETGVLDSIAAASR
jgi:DNA-binding transcriptional LysR family regulator